MDDGFIEIEGACSEEKEKNIQFFLSNVALHKYFYENIVWGVCKKIGVSLDDARINAKYRILN